MTAKEKESVVRDTVLKILFAKMLSIIFILGLPTYGSTQSKQVEQKRYEEAIEKKNINERVLGLESFISTYPNSEIKREAMYQKALALTELKKYDKAIEAYEEILSLKLTNENSFKGSVLQHTKYRYFSYAGLSEIYIELKDFDKAIKCANKADKKYTCRHHPVNELMDYKAFVAIIFSDIYKAKGEYEKSLNYIMPYFFSENDEIVESIVAVLDQMYSADQITFELTSAKQNLHIGKNKFARINMFGYKLKIFEGLMNMDGYILDTSGLTQSQKANLFHQIIEQNSIYEHYASAL
ncbi:tetratricopeptide repeat protein [Aureibacter tunicatorum]|uniref:Tetratricopeptide (TPR) repeat protein n=1 Tax=Aureibacter tunicatorum TaxID=866807 RepID=A0AAE4BPY1_9BACT|nr:tetratricopeptide repeat protein [Aureibacter tunicatorum]MDR6238479.1 tetratricopeptide (TPR) repeat protein [Aureibacter tunicatorum]BDD05588.1 hypothetical protein AUTU_30710 [Aureibacter tunicatorum]